MIYKVSTDIKHIEGTINLPSSKSISNRALIINALSYSPYPIRNLSDSDDTSVITSYSIHYTKLYDIAVQNELVAAINELRDELARSKFGKPYTELDEDQASAVREIYPQKISEAEPKGKI